MWNTYKDSMAKIYFEDKGPELLERKGISKAEFARRMGIQSDIHTLAKRQHCFQRQAAPGTGSYTWLDRIWEFMNAKGFNR